MESLTTGNTSHIKEKWELEIHVIIKDHEWENGLVRGHKITNSQYLKELNWKLNLRYCRTILISKFYNTKTNLC